MFTELDDGGEVFTTFALTRYNGDKTIEAWQCRVSRYVPAPGRKPKVA